MAVISMPLGYLFLHAPRTGGTALSGILVDRLQGSWLPKQSVEVEARGERRRVRQHITRPQLLAHGLLTQDQAARLLTFTTVRNPFDSLVSSWVKKRDRVAGTWWAGNHPVTRAQVASAAAYDFPTFIEVEYGFKKPRHLSGKHLDGADVVLRFEHLQDDFDLVVERLGVGERIEIPRINTTDRNRDHRPYYTPEARMVIERVFAPDLERFGYEF